MTTSDAEFPIPIALPADLALYLGIDVATIDTDRAELMITLAQAKCEAIVFPLPDAALGVVLDVAGRAYTNVTNAQQQTTGPYSAGFGGVSGGLWLTRANIAELRRLGSSKSGAFTIDPTPADAGAGKVWAQLPETVSEMTTSPPFYGDWDAPA